MSQTLLIPNDRMGNCRHHGRVCMQQYSVEAKTCGYGNKCGQQRINCIVERQPL
jgi:hypothetical protein